MARFYHKCYFCGGHVSEKKVIVDYRWGEDLITVFKNVPAGVCQQCGEKYLESGVYKELERLAKSKSHATGKMTIDVLAFEASATA